MINQISGFEQMKTLTMPPESGKLIRGYPGIKFDQFMSQLDDQRKERVIQRSDTELRILMTSDEDKARLRDIEKRKTFWVNAFSLGF